MIDLKCNNTQCGRHLGEAESIIADILCAGCKGSTQFKILSNDQSKLINYKFVKPERSPKKKEVEVS